MDQDSLLRQREMRIERESEKGEGEREEREGVVLSLQFGSSFKQLHAMNKRYLQVFL